MKNDIVSVVDNKPMTTSLIVAKKFKREHKNVLQAIEKLDCSGDFFAANFSAATFESRGKQYPMYQMTRDGFTFLCMGFTGHEAAKWKEAYIKVFNAMEAEILKKEQKKQIDWKGARSQSIVSRNDLTDTIKQFVEYATEQGSKNAKNHYANITRMEYAALGLLEQLEGEKSNLRDCLNIMELVQVSAAEFQAKNAIDYGMARQMHYKDIYALAKQQVIRFADSILIPKIGEQKRVKHPE